MARATLVGSGHPCEMLFLATGSKQDRCSLIFLINTNLYYNRKVCDKKGCKCLKIVEEEPSPLDFAGL